VVDGGRSANRWRRIDHSTGGYGETMTYPIGRAMVRVSGLVLVLVAFALSVLSAAAEAGTFKFKPSADTYVNQAHPNRNYGGAKWMWASGGAGSRRATFARFDVSGISGTVTRAKLRLYVSNATRNGPAVYRTSASWSESGVTWKARPSTTSRPRGDKGRLARNRWVAWDVTRWVRADGTYSFALKQGAADAAGFLSREAAKEPTLVITTAPEPAPVAGRGYHEAFRDDFDALGSTVWGEGIWYAPGAPANSIFVQDGALNLVSRRSQGYKDITVTTEAGSSPLTFRRGYFEARMKWTKGKGAWPAFWLSSYRHATNPVWPSINPYCQDNGLPAALCWNSELDVFEGQGAEPNVFYGTLHRNTNSLYGVPDSTNDPAWKTVGAELTNGFHTYGALWTATEVRWYLDGVEMLRTPAFDSTDQPMFLIFDMWIGWADNPDASTPDELKTQVDYVTVWQK
jgi:beta-glucanase (GH16 family)